MKRGFALILFTLLGLLTNQCYAESNPTGEPVKRLNAGVESVLAQLQQLSEDQLQRIFRPILELVDTEGFEEIIGSYPNLPDWSQPYAKFLDGFARGVGIYGINEAGLTQCWKYIYLLPEQIYVIVREFKNHTYVDGVKELGMLYKQIGEIVLDCYTDRVFFGMLVDHLDSAWVYWSYIIMEAPWYEKPFPLGAMLLSYQRAYNNWQSLTLALSVEDWMSIGLFSGKLLHNTWIVSPLDNTVGNLIYLGAEEAALYNGVDSEIFYPCVNGILEAVNELITGVQIMNGTIRGDWLAALWHANLAGQLGYFYIYPPCKSLANLLLKDLD